jgi:hypothetical protein
MSTNTDTEGKSPAQQDPAQTEHTSDVLNGHALGFALEAINRAQRYLNVARWGVRDEADMADALADMHDELARLAQQIQATGNARGLI